MIPLLTSSLIAMFCLSGNDLSLNRLGRAQVTVDAIQMCTHNIYKCLYKEEDKKYTGCNLKTTELLDCALTGVCNKVEYGINIYIYIYIYCLDLKQQPY